MAETIRIKVIIDGDQAKRGSRQTKEYLLDIEQAAERTERSTRRLGVGTVAAGNIMAEIYSQVAQQAMQVVRATWELGTTAEETGSKFRTVLGPDIDRANAFIEEYASMMGLSVVEAQEMIATNTAIAQGFGFVGESAFDTAQEVVKLAGDLQSFNNVPIEQTQNAITSALSGETEALKTLGIVIRQADVTQKALNQTGKKSVDQLNQQERATATLSLITERAGLAIGDLERTQDSASNTSRRVQAELRNVASEISTELMPLYADLLGVIEEVIGSEAFDQFVEEIKGMIRGSIRALEAGSQYLLLFAEDWEIIWRNMTNNIARIFLIGIEAMMDKAAQEIAGRERDWTGIASAIGNKFGSELVISVIETSNAFWERFGLVPEGFLEDTINQLEDRARMGSEQLFSILKGEATANWKEWKAIAGDAGEDFMDVLLSGVDRERYRKVLKELQDEAELALTNNSNERSPRVDIPVNIVIPDDEIISPDLNIDLPEIDVTPLSLAKGVIGDLNRELEEYQRISLALGDTQGDVAYQIQETASAIEYLMRQGYTAQDEAIKGLINRLKEYQKQMETQAAFTEQLMGSQIQNFRDLGNAIREQVLKAIKAKIAEAVATQIAKIIAGVPFPLNLALAAGAGGGVQLLFNQIPEFRTGVDNFEGGLAKVHKNEVITYLPEGSNVLTNRNVEAMERMNKSSQTIPYPDIKAPGVDTEAITSAVREGMRGVEIYPQVEIIELDRRLKQLEKEQARFGA